MHWQDSQTSSDFRSGPFPLPRLFFEDDSASTGEKGRGKGKGPERNPEKQQMGRYVRDCRGKPAAGRGLAAESPT